MESLEKQEKAYRSIGAEAEEKLRAHGFAPEKESPYARVGLKIGMQAQMLFDRSDAHLIDIAAQGHQMGEEQIAHALERYPDAENGDRELAERMVRTEKAEREEMDGLLN